MFRNQSKNIRNKCHLLFSSLAELTRYVNFKNMVPGWNIYNSQRAFHTVIYCSFIPGAWREHMASTTGLCPHVMVWFNDDHKFLIDVGVCVCVCVYVHAYLCMYMRGCEGDGGGGGREQEGTWWPLILQLLSEWSFS